MVREKRTEPLGGQEERLSSRAPLSEKYQVLGSECDAAGCPTLKPAVENGIQAGCDTLCKAYGKCTSPNQCRDKTTKHLFSIVTQRPDDGCKNANAAKPIHCVVQAIFDCTCECR
jgi:hypothetical protein